MHTLQLILLVLFFCSISSCGPRSGQITESEKFTSGNYKHELLSTETRELHIPGTGSAKLEHAGQIVELQLPATISLSVTNYDLASEQILISQGNIVQRHIVRPLDRPLYTLLSTTVQSSYDLIPFFESPGVQNGHYRSINLVTYPSENFPAENLLLIDSDGNELSSGDILRRYVYTDSNHMTQTHYMLRADYIGEVQVIGETSKYVYATYILH